MRRALAAAVMVAIALATLPALANPSCGLVVNRKGSAVRSADMRSASRALYGDSISVQGHKIVLSQDQAMRVDAQSGRRTAPTVDILERDLGFGAAPAVVIMAIGTNDARDPDGIAQQVLRARNLLPVQTRLLWANAYLDTNDGWRQVDAQIAAVPGVEVLDWAGANLLARGERPRSPYLSDGVHLNCAGARAWVRMVEGAVKSPPKPVHQFVDATSLPAPAPTGTPYPAPA